MPPKLIISLLFFAVSVVVLASGIFTLQGHHKASINRVFLRLQQRLPFGPQVWQCLSFLLTLHPANSFDVFQQSAGVLPTHFYYILY